MKRYLSAVFIIISVITIFIGYRSDARWSGMITWGLVLIFLLLAAYFTKFIQNNEEKEGVEE